MDRAPSNGSGGRSGPSVSDDFVGRTRGEIFAELKSSSAGLVAADAAARLVLHGANTIGGASGNHPLAVLFRQFRSPMVLILLAAAALSFALGETVEASIVVGIVLASTGLGFYQEYRAGNALAELQRRIAVTSSVLRDGRPQQVPASQIVPGDVLLLGAGSLVTADCLLLEATALHVDEAALTGESFPVEKSAAPDSGAIIAGNIVRLGTSVRSGVGRAVVVETGTRTEFGGIAHSVGTMERETSFALGIRRFGLLMTQIMLVLVTLVLVVNILLGRPVLDSLLFAAALAVGITPELLPAIVTVTLSRGAEQLTRKGLLVRRLVAIENLGSMDVLCTDKTGTLTAGDVRLEQAVDTEGEPSPATLQLALLNASLQSATPNPLDSAIIAAQADADISSFRRLGEIPYDFERKRLSVLVASPDGNSLIAKGAVAAILPVCTTILIDGVCQKLTAERREIEERRLAAWCGEGARVLAMARRDLEPDETAGDVAQERDLTLCGYLLFSDPLKPGIVETVAALRDNGIQLRIVSGDNRYVAAHIAASIRMPDPVVVAGPDLEGLNPRSFARLIADANVFAEITPDQKERIVSGLRQAGHTVGYLGDGINDAPALRAADIGISVDNAVDAAKAAADVILLRQDLGVLLDGVISGRTAFGNTVKYIAITISANLGNMISMAVASLLLPFLPLLATQILLNNALSDLPMLAISTDRVDAETLKGPQRWDFRALVRSMIAFGLLSSVFDGLTFLVLLGAFHSNEAFFQTSWFIESLLTELAVVAVMRTRKPFFRSAPSRLLIWSSLSVAAVAIAVPYSPLGPLLGFVPLPPVALAAVAGIVIAYVGTTELLKPRIGAWSRRERTPTGHAVSRT